MKRMTVLLALAGVATALAETHVLECERFADRGGWSVDSQFIDEMGSSYLLAHGLGRPVADASTTLVVKEAGRYDVLVRTKNWTAKWSAAEGAGRFAVVVNGVELPAVLGVQGQGEWLWVKAGSVTLKSGGNTLALRDKTGFDGRCDAVALSNEPACERQFTQSAARLPESVSASLLPPGVRTVSADLVVAGGGIAGICTAISAARLGLSVALVQDRPVLGGANSSEVRVHLGGYQNLGEYPRLGDVVSEIGPAKGGNAQPAERYEDDRKLAAVKAETNITLVLNCRVVGVETCAGSEAEKRIAAVVGRDVVTGTRTRFVAPLFADCTGDGCVGALAGADWRLGRESKAMTGEKDAVEVADRQTLGASCQWYSVRRTDAEGGVAFPNEPWMIRFNEEAVDYKLRGDWDWETGMLRDQLMDFETVRDYAMLVAYSNWNHVKNIGPRKGEFSDADLVWLAHVAGKRETRRLLGDHILTQEDVFEQRPHPDGTCCTTWAIDLHYPMPANRRNYDGEPFRSICTHDKHYPYPIPYRCFYSRNVPNLFMAGRDISVTHVALGTTRVMRTHGMMGEVVGMAASICKRRSCDPRGVYADHLDELKALMTKGVGRGDPQPPQTYNRGACLFRPGEDPREPQMGILTPAVRAEPRINGARIFGVRPGHPVLWRIPVSGERPLAICVRGLPEGVVYDEKTQSLSGSTTVRGDHDFVVTATNSRGSATRKMTLRVGDTICLTPPMGWNSWNCWQQDVSDEKIRRAADAMVSSGLADHGWNYVVVDDGWRTRPTEQEAGFKRPSWIRDPQHMYGPRRLADGTPVSNAHFPDMAAMAAHIHGKGLRAGLYSVPSEVSCCYTFGSWKHEAKDAETWARWGYDLVKYDWCYGDRQYADRTKPSEWQFRAYSLMGDLLARQPRDIVYNVCNYGRHDVTRWARKTGAQYWRTNDDVKDTWEKVLQAIDANLAVSDVAGPGGWNDPDMLVVGAMNMNGFTTSRLTPNEQYTHISLWAIQSAPLFIGCDMERLEKDPLAWSFLTNDEVIDIDQDELGKVGRPVVHTEDYDVWARPLANGDRAVALFNRTNAPRKITVEFAAIDAAEKVIVRDVWAQKDVGAFEKRFTADVYGHATRFYRLRRVVQL